MVAATILLSLLQGLTQYPQQAGDGLDEATREHMQQRAEYLDQEMARLIQELEQKSLEQSGGDWGAPLLWHFWPLLGILILLLLLCFGAQKIRHDPDNSGQKESSSNNLEEEEEGEDIVVKKEKSNHTNVEGQNDDGNKMTGSSVDAQEESSVGNDAKGGYDDAKEEVNHNEKGEKVSDAGNEEDKHDANEEDYGPQC